MQPQGLLAPRGRGGVLPTFVAAGLAGAVGTIALYPVRALLGFQGFYVFGGAALGSTSALPARMVSGFIDPGGVQ